MKWNSPNIFAQSVVGHVKRRLENLLAQILAYFFTLLTSAGYEVAFQCASVGQ